MKISDVMARLKSVQAVHGDLEVVCYQSSGYEPVQELAGRKTTRRHGRVVLARADSGGDYAAVFFTAVLGR